MTNRSFASLACLSALALAAILGAPAPVSAQPQLQPEGWAVLPTDFESTGGGGWMILNYRPAVVGDRCITEFKVRSPDGKEISELIAAFTASPLAGGTLCTQGRFFNRSKGDSGETPLVVWIRDGVVRKAP